MIIVRPMKWSDTDVILINEGVGKSTKLKDIYFLHEIEYRYKDVYKGIKNKDMECIVNAMLMTLSVLLL